MSTDAGIIVKNRVPKFHQKNEQGFRTYVVSIGQWVYKDFELCLVTDVTEDGFIETTTGVITSSGYKNPYEGIIPISLCLKLISEEFAYSINRIREKSKGINLNWPDISRKYKSLWIESWNRFLDLTEENTKPFPNKSSELYGDLYKFEGAVIDGIKNLSSASISGISLLRSS